MKAARPPRFGLGRRRVGVEVVFPEDSGPKTSTIRPLGKPPTPQDARSIRVLPVGDGLHVHVEVSAEAHNGAFAEVLVDLLEGEIEACYRGRRAPCCRPQLLPDFCAITRL